MDKVNRYKVTGDNFNRGMIRPFMIYNKGEDKDSCVMEIIIAARLIWLLSLSLSLSFSQHSTLIKPNWNPTEELPGTNSNESSEDSEVA